MKRLPIIALLLALAPAWGSYLIPMDSAQTDHLKAYGVAYWVLAQGYDCEWLLNYRGGSWLTPDVPGLAELSAVRGVTLERVDPGAEAAIRATVEAENMEAVLLEKAPLVAVYAPYTYEPWDDAVMLALTYAEIPYEHLWDAEVLAGELGRFDWLHLHHEDFTGQYGKFSRSEGDAEWFRSMRAEFERAAREAGYPTVPEHKLAVAEEIVRYVEGGGFLFAMCSAPASLDVALAAAGIDIVDAGLDGTPVSPGYNARLDYSRCLAFTGFEVYPDPDLYEISSIDSPRGRGLYDLPAGVRPTFTLFEFAAKFDPVPTILTQCHVATIADFMGQDTAFVRDQVKDSCVVLATVDGLDEVKYLYGVHGEGAFSFLGGHDPEDFQHFIGDPPTELSLFSHSPGYRLILNNVLFPAAKKKPLKT
jgi:hypothetical protein